MTYAPFIGWALFAGVAAVPLWKMLTGLIEWEDRDATGAGRKVTVGGTTAIATIGALGALYFVGAGAGVVVSGGGGVGVPAAAAIENVPETPSAALGTFAPTGDSIRVVSSPFAGDGSLDSVEFQLDTAGGSFDPSKYHNVVLGAVLVDTALAVDSGAHVKARTRHKNSAGWSAWSDTTRVWAAGPFEPAGMTVVWNEPGTTNILDWDNSGWSLPDPGPGPSGQFDSTRVFLKTGEYNPTGEATVIRVDHPLADSIEVETRGAVVINEYDILSGVTVGNADTLYVRFRYKLNGTAPGGKHFYSGISAAADLGAITGTADYYLTLETNGGMQSAENGVLNRGLLPFASGGPDSFVVNDTVFDTQPDSGIVTALQIDTLPTAGSWAGGDQAGWIWLKEETGQILGDSVISSNRASNIATASQTADNGGPSGSIVGPGNNNVALPETGGDWATAWHVLEMLMVAESSPGAKDGYTNYWLDGRLLRTGTSSPYFGSPYTSNGAYFSSDGASESSFNGFRWVLNNGQGGTPKGFAYTMDWGEFYISVKEN